MRKLAAALAILFIVAVGAYLALNYLQIPLTDMLRGLTQGATTATTRTVTETPEKTTTEGITTAERTKAGLELLEEIHRSLDPKRIPELMEIIRSHPEPYVRERAVFVLTDIAIRGNRVDEVIDFLKEIAYEEKEDNVRTAAYANLDIIRTYYPLDLGADVSIRLEGEIRKGSNVTLVITVSSGVSVPEARAGIVRIVDMASDTALTAAMVMSTNPVKFSLSAGNPEEVRFTVYLVDAGEYGMDINVRLSLDRVDYQNIKKVVYLKVGEDRGEYLVANDIREISMVLANRTATRVTKPLEAILLNPADVYFSAAEELPGRVYDYNYPYDSLTQILKVENRRVYSFSFHSVPYKVYYVDRDSREVRLFILGLGDYGVAFEHEAYVRCVRFRAEDSMLYFSEVSGGYGKIYRLADGRAELYYLIRLEDVDGFWAGYFDLGKDGALYLSSGNRMPASIYVAEDLTRPPRRIATFNFSVAGIRYVEGISLLTPEGDAEVGRGILMADWRRSIYLYDLDNGGLYKIYGNERFNTLSDVSLAR